MDPVLSVQDVSKTFGKRKVLHNVSFDVMPGEIFGFLGPNGAGKTTCIKMITGLLKTESGEILIGGRSVRQDFESALKNVGGIIENPEMYGHLTGRDNLKIYARMSGSVPNGRLDEVISLVKLSNRIDEKVKKYSLGMRQRLGVAQALISRPNLLVLDEPTNGLDPMGIKELRDILHMLAQKEGMAVLVSSHLLSEMEMMCGKVGIIDAGRMVDTRSMTEMRIDSAAKAQPYTIECSEPQKVLGLISPGCPDAVLDGDKLNLLLTREEAADLVELLSGKGIRVYSVCAQTTSLEDAFLNMTTGSKDQIV